MSRPSIAGPQLAGISMRWYVSSDFRRSSSIQSGSSFLREMDSTISGVRPSA